MAARRVSRWPRPGGESLPGHGSPTYTSPRVIPQAHPSLTPQISVSSSAEAAPIRLRILGPLDLRDSDGDAVSSVLRQPKRLALLGYLALAPGGGGRLRDEVLALFWPELDDRRARNSLNQAFYHLRQALGREALPGALEELLRVDRSLVWCDACAFQDRIAAGEDAAALDLYRGGLLEGLHVVDAAPELDVWLEAERRRLAK